MYNVVTVFFLNSTVLGMLLVNRNLHDNKGKIQEVQNKSVSCIFFKKNSSWKQVTVVILVTTGYIVRARKKGMSPPGGTTLKQCDPPRGDLLNYWIIPCAFLTFIAVLAKLIFLIKFARTAPFLSFIFHFFSN